LEFFNIQDEICCEDINVLGNIFCDILGNLKYECVLAAYLDDKMKLKGIAEIARGTTVRVDHSINDIYMCAMHFSTRKIVLAHNHPNGSLQPSSADIRATEVVSSVLAINNVNLVEHFIICGEDYYTIIGNN